ncbi:class I SAM-dependent methyltransferase family protein, partial [Candidatus Aenigmatarchaeota archaeon]
ILFTGEIKVKGITPIIAFVSVLPRIKTVCEILSVSGELREPIVKKIVGSDTETVHKEHGILYKMDVTKVMFSKGNLGERSRLIARSGERVLDMFAGIGYFSLSLAKQGANVTSIEKNPVAFHYLKENIKLNNVKINAINSDCRDFSINHEFDRILMGYFPGTEKFLPTALKMIKNNGIIHFHNTYRENELWSSPIKQISNVIDNFKIINKKKVKSVAPHTWHVVIDFSVEK